MATYSPGTVLTVGSHVVTIDKWLSKGGFANVYTARCSPPSPTGEIVCLKRVAVPTKALLNLLRAEVDAMQRLEGAPNIVQYIDSHAERNKDPTVGGYEVFVLMEFCAGGGLIDFMNTRLRDQLREQEVLKIMYDITWGLAEMHAMNPPLIHRDLKIENVLLTGDGDYKLCDFGSASPILRAPKNPQELQILDDDIQHHTTAQYRSPEMLDLYRGFPIDEKSDIWALGVFLYKLCYYTTPFEQEGVPAILNASYVIPSKPPYSNRLKNVIRVLLQPNPQNRPTTFQVMDEICSMLSVPNPLSHTHAATQPVSVKQTPKSLPLSDYSKSSDSQSSHRISGEYSRSPEPYYKSPELSATARTPALTPEMKAQPFGVANQDTTRQGEMELSPVGSPIFSDHGDSFDVKYPPLAPVSPLPAAVPLSNAVPPVKLAPKPAYQKPSDASPSVSAPSGKPVKPIVTPGNDRPQKPQLATKPVPKTNTLAHRPHTPTTVASPLIGPSGSQSTNSGNNSLQPASARSQPSYPPQQGASQSQSYGKPTTQQPSQAALIQERAMAQIEAARAMRSSSGGYGSQSEMPERSKLQQILGGLNERTNTVFLSNDSHVDSSMDFLRTLNTKEQPGDRGSSSGSHLTLHKPHTRRSSWLHRSGSRHRSREQEPSFTPEVQTPERSSPDPFGTSTEEQEGSIGSDSGSPAPSMRDFKPTNSIQQRVHNLVSHSHNSQTPPRVARGYGKFTDDVDDEYRATSPISQKSKSVPTLADMPTTKKIVKRPKPILHAATGPQGPRDSPELVQERTRPPKPGRSSTAGDK